MAAILRPESANGNRPDATGDPGGPGSGAAHPPLLVVAGPTASGKSALALAVAEAFGGVVINADALQVYHELRILTARPTAEDETRVPHRLYGILPAGERCSAGRWLGLARPRIEAAWRSGRLPVVTGGTGFYIAALMEGLSPIPPVPEAVRMDLVGRAERDGLAALHARLSRGDPEAAHRIAPGDRQRILRALEVLEATGRPLSEWQAAPPDPPPLAPGARVIRIDPPRERLYAAIDRRFARMVETGAIAEVEALLALALDPALPAMKAVGVPELAAHIRGRITLDEAISRASRASRRYAKRQMTWFRHRVRPSLPLNEQFSESQTPSILPIIRDRVLTSAP